MICTEMSLGSGQPAHPAHTDLSVELLLDEAVFEGARVGAGHQGLTRVVQWCLPLAEVATTAEALDGVVVFAGRALGRAVDEEADALVRSLRSRGAVALLVDAESARLSHVAAAAELVTLPLVIMRRGTAYSTVSRLVAEKTLAQRSHVMAYAETVRATLAEVLFRGAGLSAVAQQLSMLSQRPVVIANAELEAQVVHGLDAAALEAVEPAPGALRRSLESAGLLQAVVAQGVAVEVRLPLERGPMWSTVAPIVLGGTLYGWVLILEGAESARAHDLARHRVVAEQGATIAGTEMLRLRSVEEARERTRGDFVDALLHGRFTDQRELAARAAHHRFDVAARYAVLVADIGADLGTPAGSERLVTGQRMLRALTTEVDRPALLAAVGDLLAVVHPMGSSGGHTRQRLTAQNAEVEDHAAALRSQLATRLGGDCAVAYGRPYAGARGIPTSYREARLALSLARTLRQPGNVWGYASLRVYGVLAGLAASPEGRGFTAEVLEPLRTFDRQNRNNLEEVVTAYVACGGNLNAAARMLALHRNTLLYKLDQASRLLEMDLRDPENQFSLWLARKLGTLGEVEAALDAEMGAR